MPRLVEPMSPTTLTGDPPTGPDWRIEVAWTGHRCIAYVHPDGRVRLLSGAANSLTHAYPELVAPLRDRCPPGGMVLDGMLVARGEEHAPRPRLLQRRHARYKPTQQEIAAVPVDLQVADLLFLDGHSLVDLPWRDRRSLLEGLGFAEAPVWTTAVFPAAELDHVSRVATGKGVDAFHAHHLGGRYRPGGASRFWLRVPVRLRGQVVIGGWTATDPRRPEAIAALLLGVPEDGGLRYVGRVGVSSEQRRRLAPVLRGTERGTSPFAEALPSDSAANAVWAAPRLVGRVEFVGWLGGEQLRKPRWHGLVEAGELDERGWARPPRPAAVGSRAAGPVQGEPTPPVDAPSSPARTSPAAPERPVPDIQDRRLEQHFVYNSLNTIASLIRTDPGRARELLVGFADLTRTTDGPGTSTLGRELDAVRAYLRLEQARFGRRLRVRLDVDPGLEAVPVPAARLVAAVRGVVQAHVEPRPEGGLLAVEVRADGVGCRVTVTAEEQSWTLQLPEPVTS